MVVPCEKFFYLVTFITEPIVLNAGAATPFSSLERIRGICFLGKTPE